MNTIKLPTGIFEYDPAKPLGRRGGFGQVFAGQTANGDEVAVKKLHVSAADAAHRELRVADEFRGRTFRNVIPFIDSGEDADTGDYFVIMPRAERSLQSVIDSDGPLNASGTANVLLQIVNGLIEVGEVVHRDIKPDNILFHEGKWKVADFGIARFLEAATSNNTLKDCLSPGYAAPEQWRLERSAHATDVYALGCVGYCLLTGTPPFTENPSEEHQNAIIPSFQCDDSRLSALINMMLRKRLETRPDCSRIKSQLEIIISKPHQMGGDESLSVLAKASAAVSEKEQQIQAQQQAAAAAEKARKELARSSLQILSESVERLWEKIYAQAPNSKRGIDSNPPAHRFSMGVGSLHIFLSPEHYLQAGVFSNSGWDVIQGAWIGAHQSQGDLNWSSSLFYAKPKDVKEYRWYEVSFWRTGHIPFACGDLKEADYALSKNIASSTNVAFGPVIIDDEMEDDFHGRWIWMLAQAAEGKLRRPAMLPIGCWPPQFV